MKKILAMLLALTMIVSLSACNASVEDLEKTDPEPTAETAIPDVSIDNNGNVVYSLTYSTGKNDLSFEFDGDKLKSAEALITVYDSDLLESIKASLDDYSAYFDKVESDDAAKTLNLVYSENGMKACQFTDKTRDELVEYLKAFAEGTESGLPLYDANMIAAGNTPYPAAS